MRLIHSKVSDTGLCTGFRLVEYVVPVILLSALLNIPKFFETELYYEDEPTMGNVSRYGTVCL